MTATCVIPVYTQTLALIPASVRVARMSVRTTLTCWGLAGLTEDAELIVSELLSNAVQHATPVLFPGDDPGRCRLTIERPAPGTVRIWAADSSCRRLERRSASPQDEHGRGLAVLDALATAWDVVPTATGKVVRVELGTTGPGAQR
ncbi:ATP-binding protein [Streptomyces sp. NPDC059122]|uniref:ATP-binding protein n=1 Tax=Streptomyces sp. NPDC059122 TaxID=3346732 RepID=UPI0036B93182